MVRYLAVFTALFFSLHSGAHICDTPLMCDLPKDIIEQVITCNDGRTVDESFDCDGQLYVDAAIADAPTVDGVPITVDFDQVYKEPLWWSMRYWGHAEGFYGSYTGTLKGTANESQIVSKDCNDPNYPTEVLYNSESFCLIAVCNDGYYGDPSVKGNVCARVTPTVPYETCGETGLNVVPPPAWPDCKNTDIPEMPDLSEPPEEPLCKDMVGVDFQTTVCLVNPDDVCSDSGVCPPGCGYVTDSISGQNNFVCFGDDPSKFEKPDFDLPEDSEYDPFVEGSCRVINGTSYCPQDADERINPDGTYPKDCGYVNGKFYCIADSVVNNSVKPNSDFTEPLVSTDSSDTKSAQILSTINKDLRKGFNDVSGDLSELGRGFADLTGIEKSAAKRAAEHAAKMAERDAKRDEKLDKIIINTEPSQGSDSSDLSEITDLLTAPAPAIEKGVFDLASVQSELDTVKLDYEQYVKSLKSKVGQFITPLSTSSGSFSQCKDVISFNGQTKQVCFAQFSDEMHILSLGILLFFTIASSFLVLGAYKK